MARRLLRRRRPRSNRRGTNFRRAAGAIPAALFVAGASLFSLLLEYDDNRGILPHNIEGIDAANAARCIAVREENGNEKVPRQLLMQDTDLADMWSSPLSDRSVSIR
jgi:hypothetical protein